MADFVRSLKSDGKRAWPYIVLAAMLDLGERLVEHRILGAANDFIDAHSGPILDAVRPILIWLVHTPFVLLTITVSVILLHAYFSSHRELPNVKSTADSTSSPQEEPIQEKTPELIPDPPSHNIVFLGGDRYSPDKHGLVGGGINCDEMRFVLAEFRNKHIVGSTVAHVYNVRAGITYSDDNGTEILYVSPGEWLRHDADTVKLESGAESEFVVLAVYNYYEKSWETRKVVRTRQYWGDTFSDQSRPLPFGTITAEIVLLEKDGTALEGGTVTFELRKNGNFEIR
jgi:hypothetical protein